MAYINSRPYDFEMEKNVSLRQIDAKALLRLRETGKADFNLPEVCLSTLFVLSQ